MIRIAVNGQNDDGACPICGDTMDDRRYVSVECFYNIQEIVPDAERVQVLLEIPEHEKVWGITRNYNQGTRERPVVTNKPTGGTNLTSMKMEQDTLPPARFLERNEFHVDCCKSCRGDFLQMFKMWARGELVVSRPPLRADAAIPVHERGTIRFLSQEEWDKRRHEKARNSPKDG